MRAASTGSSSVGSLANDTETDSGGTKVTGDGRNLTRMDEWSRFYHGAMPL